MTVQELIEALKKLPPGMEVSYENHCADEGMYTVSIGNVEIRTGFDEFWRHRYSDDGEVVLS